MIALKALLSASDSRKPRDRTSRESTCPFRPEAVSCSKGAEVPGVPKDEFSTVRDFRRRRWASRRASRPVISESITGPLPEPQDGADMLERVWQTSRFFMPEEDWTTEEEHLFEEDDCFFERRNFND